MNNYRKNNSLLILVVFLTAQLGAPLHFLWINHVRTQNGAQGKQFHSPVLKHNCSHFNYVNQTGFLPPDPLATHIGNLYDLQIPPALFYKLYYDNSLQGLQDVRGPPVYLIAQH